MIFESLIAAGFVAFAYEAVVKPHLVRRRIHALVDIGRVAALAKVAREDIHFVVLSSYRVMSSDSKWKWVRRYRVNFSYKDLSTLVDGQGNPFVDIGNIVEVDATTDRRQLEERLARHLLAWTGRT